MSTGFDEQYQSQPRYTRTGCPTIMLEEIEPPIAKANRLILRLQAAAIAVDDLITEAMGDNAEHIGEVCMLRAAILEAERYGPTSQEIAERIIAKEF